MLVATGLWALVGAYIATSHVNVGLTLLGGGLGLVIYSAPKWRSLVPHLLAQWRLLLVLIVLDVVNSGCYYMALRWGPATLVTTLHLSSPLLVLGYYLIRRERSWGPLLAVESVLVSTAVILIATGGSTHHTGSHQPSWALWVAIALALFSAFSVTAINLTVGRSALTDAKELATGVALLGTGVLLMLVLSPWQPVSWGITTVTAIGVGMACFGPATALLWRSLARSPVPLVSILGTAEAPITVAFISIITVTIPAMTSILAGLALFAAVLLEIRSGDHTRPVDEEPVE